LGRVSLNSAWEAAVEGEVTALDISPKGGFCGAGTASGRLFYFGPGGRRLWEADLDAPIRVLRCSEQGEYVVALSDLLELAAFLPDGRRLWHKLLNFEATCFDLRPGSHLIGIGNRFGLIRYLTVFGKRRSGGEVPHPVDFIRFAPGGDACAAASREGHLTLLGYGGKQLWTAFLHRPLTGLDIVGRGDLILAVSRDRGLVMVDINGEGVGVYDFDVPIVAAEVDDDGRVLYALDESARLLLLDRDARLLSSQDCRFRPDKIAVDSEGKRVVVAGYRGGLVRGYIRSDSSEAVEFLEVCEKKAELKTQDDDPVRYLEI
jgi:hypothetical protein